jgi:hypothetical protein
MAVFKCAYNKKLGFDESKINYVPPPIPIIERNKEVDNEEPTILFVGHNFILKGGSISLKAFEIINKEIPKTKLIFVSNSLRLQSIVKV